MDSRPIFTIDLENWNDALHIEDHGYSNYGVFLSLMTRLKSYKIKPIIYKLEHFHLKQLDGSYVLKTHGKFHRWWENADRRPYQWLGLTGGFWFRFLPYWFVKGQILEHGLIYLHPHDLDENHPRLRNSLLNWKRHVGLKTVWKKLDRLLKEVQFGDPS